MDYKLRWQNAIQTLKNNETKIRFLLVGGLNTIVGLLTFPTLYYLFNSHDLQYLNILVVSQAFCITLAFLTNKYFVFRTKGNNLKEYIKFATFHLLYFLLNLVILPLLVEVFGVHPVIAQSAFAVLVIISSYFWYSKVTFISKKLKL